MDLRCNSYDISCAVKMDSSAAEFYAFTIFLKKLQV